MEAISTRLVRILCTFTLVAALGCVGPVTAKQPTVRGDTHCGVHRYCKDAKHTSLFNRIAVFPVYLNTDIDTESVAEIVDVSKDSNTLVYTDGVAGNLGFIDIESPTHPQAAGVVSMGGEPTSVAVVDGYALAAVNTSPSFVAPSGKLIVVDIETQRMVAEHDLGGQPDSIAVSPDGRYAAVAIENERDEELGEGEPPQDPPGYLTIVDLKGHPSHWGVRKVELVGIADRFPDDPEPEYVDINEANVAVVTLQENNHIVLVDLVRGLVIRDFSAGAVDLHDIDTLENDLIELDSTVEKVSGEPDGVSWISPSRFATADEGDLFGGSRGYTIFDTQGVVRYTSGNALEHRAVRLGHYPESRSENKGNEPENIDSARYGKDNYLFVASERSSVLFVYRLNRYGAPEFLQTLPSGLAPEGVKAIPARNLLVAASEEDSRDDGFRSVVNIYQLQEVATAEYPTIVSANRSDGTPIPWAALSGLAAGGEHISTVYSIHDSYYDKSRIYVMDVSSTPAVITAEIVLKDSRGRLAGVDADSVNDDGTVKLDPEGIAVRADGGFWVVSEGAGTVGDPERPVESHNLILGVGGNGVIDEVIELPETTNDRQVRFGFEGITSTVADDDTEILYVAFQREWADDPEGYVRIGRYDTAAKEWTFYYYPIEAPLSDNGGWVGLSDLVALGKDEFAVVERDNQAGPDAAIKRIYLLSTAGLSPSVDAPVGESPKFPVVKKQLVRDLLPDLGGVKGLVLEKIEGLTVLADGTALVVNDNDGVDDSNGETQLLWFPDFF